MSCATVLTKNIAILTIEKAAATKIFLETYYNELLYNDILTTEKKHSKRSVRRLKLISQLRAEEELHGFERRAKLRRLERRESNYLRETRRLKTRNIRKGGEFGQAASMYEVVKVVGKGSFGVVRLVREKHQDEYVP